MRNVFKIIDWLYQHCRSPSHEEKDWRSGWLELESSTFWATWLQVGMAPPPWDKRIPFIWQRPSAHRCCFFSDGRLSIWVLGFCWQRWKKTLLQAVQIVNYSYKLQQLACREVICFCDCLLTCGLGSLGSCRESRFIIHLRGGGWELVIK